MTPDQTPPPSYADLDAQRLLAALDTNKGGYAVFQTASGRSIVVCGRDRQVLSLLIKYRLDGKGLSPRNKECPRNPADALTHLTRDHGLLIGKRKITTADQNAYRGKATLSYYHLLEDVRVVTDVHDDAKQALAEYESGAELYVLHAKGPFEPFLESGSIKDESDIDLHPQCKLIGHRAFPIQRARDEAAVDAEANGGKRITPAERRRIAAQTKQLEARTRRAA